MQIVDTIDAARLLLDAARDSGGRVGLVPTMGYLHDGHVSLMTAARARCDMVMTTIFVNPLQFAPGEDLADYPRDLDRDTQRCREAGVDVLLAPAVEEMYPQPVLTEVSVGALSTVLDGISRPTHFQGVATVVAKLFNIAGPCSAFFGEKDWQQLQVITRMAADLSSPVEVVGCPIVRESDGLAMSSRNLYLEGDDRAAATVLSRALRTAVDAVAAGDDDARTVRQLLAGIIGDEPRADLDYAAVVDARSLQPVQRIAAARESGHADAGVRLLVAARVGPARLIDNTDAHDPGTLPRFDG